MKPPPYFEKVRQRAADRWDQLEADRELAGPWHQLFRQVQSPRHVLSELLQNADDAGARKASVHFDNETFAFEHDGSDFTEEQFASLCRFGFSNKRSLHTIGFRGIGFKSTFSLGSTVEVLSPSLAVCFHQQRFTEPRWIDGASPSDSTIVRVTVADKNRGNQLRGSLQEWSESPSSLLFFKNLRELSIDGTVVRKRVTKQGPVERSQFLTLTGEETERLFFVQSEAETLPEDAAEEVRGERGLADLEDLHLPPCEIEIVLGLKAPQRLYVVLPTGAEVPVPFSINAPFIQDPARMKIKDPATSPTNRWLLERAGRLLAKTLIGWLANKELDLADRARAYELLPGSTTFDSSLGGQCADIIFEAFNETVDGERVVLTTQGSVVSAGETLAVPTPLHAVWEPTPLREIFGSEDHSHVVASEVSSSSVEAMSNRDWITALDTNDIVSRLGRIPEVPRPRGWENLQRLWEFISAERSWDYYLDSLRGLRLVPVQGDKLLYPAKESIRLSSKRDQLKDADWEFLLDHTRSVASDWIIWLSKLPPSPEKSSRSRTVNAGRLLQRLGLNEATPVDRVVSHAFGRLLEPGKANISDCVRMAQIMAALSATIPEGFQFVTRDRHLSKAEHGVVWDEAGELDEVVPEEWANEHFLHESYESEFVSCTSEQWKTWVASPSSGLHLSIPIEETDERPWYRSSVEKIAVERGGHAPAEYHYKRDSFRLDDYDFPEEVVDVVSASPDSAETWRKLLDSVLRGPTHSWKEKLRASIRHIGNTNEPLLDCGVLCAKWILRLRSLPCLPDTFGNLHIPTDLLLRTPDTEPLMSIEQFVHANLDVAANRPLLRALGVRDNPADPHKILDRLRGISKGPDPSRVITEIARLYEALDRVVARMTPAQLAKVTEIFAKEDLILSGASEWLSAGEISIFGDPEAAAPGIHPAVQRLAMWPRVNISDHPAIEKIIEWLQGLESGSKLDPSEVKRIRQVLHREPSRIWHTCGHWVSLSGTWERVEALRFRITMQELTKWADLSPTVKKTTADLRMLSEDSARLEIFDSLRNLSDVVKFRVTQCEGGDSASLPGWLDELASGLCRIKLSSEEETQRVRGVAERLRLSTWHRFHRIEVTPYVDGDPAGEAGTSKALWLETTIYLADIPFARLHKDLSEELSRPFGNSSVTPAFAACIDRERDFVRDYLETTFTLDQQMSLAEIAPAKKEKPQPPPRDEQPDESNDEPEDYDPAEAEDQNSEGDDERGPEESPTNEDEHHRQKPAAPHDPTLIERYAKKHGFHKNGGGGFAHNDGRRLRKDEQPFHWAETGSDGDLIRRLWLCEQRLSTGIEVSHELWQTMKRNPDTCAILVLDEDSSFARLTGRQINQKKEAGQVSVFPAKYRVVETIPNFIPAEGDGQ